MILPAGSPLRLCNIFLAAVSVTILSAMILSVTILGCGADAPSSSPLAGGQLRGMIHGGQQAVAGASVQLYAAGTAGYGAAATALLPSPVVSGSDGSFTITGDYTCPSSSSQLYIVATGGNPGLMSAANNSALAMMTALGPCSLHGSQYTLDPDAFIAINEVTTVASVYALGAFMGGDATHVGSSSTNAVGLANSFALVNNLINTTTGTALTTTPSGNGTVPQAAINTLADILAYCVNTDGTGTPCAALFAAATPSGGTAPTDTIQAIFNVARNPVNQVSTLYAMTSAAAAFQPTLSSVPTDWVLAVKYMGSAVGGTGLAIDASGDAWISNSPYQGPYSVMELSSNGTILSGANGYTGGGLSMPTSIAIDPTGDAWVTGAGNVVELSSSGMILSGASGYTGGGLTAPVSIALDGQGNAWVADEQSGSENAVLIKLDSSGNILSGASGFPIGSQAEFDLAGVGIDRSGNAWVGNGNAQAVEEFSPDGSLISPGSGYSVPGVYPIGVAFDGTGNAWVNSLYTSVLGKLNSAGAALSPSGGYPKCLNPGISGGYVTTCFFYIPEALALDGAGNVWSGAVISKAENGRVPDTMYTYGVAKMSNTGTILSGAVGYNGGTPVAVQGIAIDGGGNVWVLASAGFLLEYVGAATPVVTPFSLGVKNGTLGSRP
jgi:hypothetical protein